MFSKYLNHGPESLMGIGLSTYIVKPNCQDRSRFQFVIFLLTRQPNMHIQMCRRLYIYLVILF